MSIYSKADVRAAFLRALKLDSCRATAVAATAQALGLTVEIVEHCISQVEAVQ